MPDFHPPLELRGLTKSLGSFTLDAVDLAIPPGTIVGLVGANGAGKSTLMKLVLGLLAPDAGEIRLFGDAPDAPGIRSRIGFVQESPGLHPHLSPRALGDLVGPFYPRWSTARFRELCARFQVPDRKPFATLSQGMRMKTALALALSHEAELLLLDEPTSGLDPLARRDILDVLLEVIQDEQKSVLFSTHITSDLERVADHVAILKGGRLVLSGVRDDLLEEWSLVKGDESLLEGPLGAHVAGGQRTALGLDLLCHGGQALAPLLPPEALLERPSLEDLVFFHGRELEAPCTR